MREPTLKADRLLGRGSPAVARGVGKVRRITPAEDVELPSFCPYCRSGLCRSKPTVLHSLPLISA